MLSYCDMIKYLQVMKETGAVTSSISLSSPTTTTKTTSLPINTAGNLAATRRPEDQGKIMEVAGTQTEGKAFVIPL